MTFQASLIGKEGIVVASDRRLTDVKGTGEGGQAQFLATDKFRCSDEDAVICFAAGSDRAIRMAEAIAMTPPDDATELKWMTGLEARADEAAKESRPRDVEEVIVIRKGTPDRVWLVKKNGDTRPVANPIYNSAFCTGTPASARFVVEHLFHRNLTLTEMQSLAVLAVALAARKNRESVGDDIDLLTVTASGPDWKKVSIQRAEGLATSFADIMNTWLCGVVLEETDQR